MSKIINWIFGSKGSDLTPLKETNESSENDNEVSGDDDTKSSSGSSNTTSTRFSLNFDTDTHLENERKKRMEDELEALLKAAEEEESIKREILSQEKIKQDKIRIEFEHSITRVLNRGNGGATFESKIIDYGINTIQQAESILTKEQPRVMEFVIKSPLGLIKANIHNTFCSTSMYGSNTTNAVSYFNDPKFHIMDLDVVNADGSCPEKPMNTRSVFEKLENHLQLEISSHLRTEIPKDFIEFSELGISDFFKEMQIRASINLYLNPENDELLAQIKYDDFDSGILAVNSKSIQIEDHDFVSLFSKGTPDFLSPEKIDDEIFRKSKLLGIAPTIGNDEVLSVAKKISRKISCGLDVGYSDSEHRISITIPGARNISLHNFRDRKIEYISYSTMHRKLTEILNDSSAISELKHIVEMEERRRVEISSQKQSKGPRR